MPKSVDMLGVAVTYAIYLCCMLTFICRLLGKPELGRWFGYPLLLTGLPLAYLLMQAPRLGRPFLYYVQIGLMLAFLLVELLVDYVFQVDFRHTGWAVICYVVLFFTATGGMLGVAAYGGTVWIVTAVILFFIVAILAFVQRAVTGM